MKKSKAWLAFRGILVLMFIAMPTTTLLGQSQMTAAQLAALTPLDPAAVPAFGNFHFLVGPEPGQPWPPLPCPPNNLPEATPIYDLGGGTFLIDDTTVNWAQIRQEEAMEPDLRSLEVEYGLAGPMAMQGGGGTLDPMEMSSFPSNSLWLAISQITNGVVPVIINGTSPDVMYELLSKRSLTDAVWFSEGTVPGAENQDWTPTTVTVGSRTNSLFLWCRSWISSDGSGIPDWWEQLYFGTNAVDPYALCPSNSWTISQNYQNCWNPYHYYTPPPPQNVAAVLDSTGTNAVITWASGGGPVTGYQVWFGGWSTSVDNDTFSSTFSSFPFIPDATFTVRAYFAAGDYADSQPTRATASRLNSSMTAIRGPGGQLYLVVGSVPPELASVRLYWWDGASTSSIDMSAASFVNGVAPLPLQQMTGYSFPVWFNAQCISTNGSRGAVATLRPYPDDFSEKDNVSGAGAWGFVDARRHLKENLKFLLGSASATLPFSYASSLRTDGYDSGVARLDEIWSPEQYYARPPSPSGYEYYGFHFFSADLNYSILQELRPVRENYLWRNFAYDSGDFDTSGYWTNGVYCDPYPPGLRTLLYPNYELTCMNCYPLPLGFAITNHPYLFGRFIAYLTPEDFTNSLAEVGVALSGDNMFIPSGARNAYGLSVNSVLFNCAAPLERYTLNAGGAALPSWLAIDDDCFCSVEVPALQTVGYHFASQTRYLNWELNGWPGYGALAGDPPQLPGSPTFSVTNTSPLLITGFGQSITVSGWAKLAIGNGYSSKYAYLEQYFTNAFTMGGDGVATTNQAGLLSPYGEFFPMQPGPAALVTMPDIDPPYRQGTGVVNVIKLQLDVNHDGTMDLSFGGPDNTSQVRPYTFWVNNDRDMVTQGMLWIPDDDRHDVTPNGMTDCQLDFIASRRDLEDFARLWICGVPALTNGGYQVSLSWASISSGNPSIKLFKAAETNNGGTGYLTDTNIALLQTTWATENSGAFYHSLGTISSSQSLIFASNFFTNGATKYFLFEGCTPGAGQLVLTISQVTAQGSNVIAQTGAWLDLHDVKEFYERAVITNNMSGAKSDWISGVETVEYASTSSLGDDTNLIVMVHGIDVDNWHWQNGSETVFKRLYWAGFHGKFATVKWPCNLLTPIPSPLTPANFNESELQGYKASTSLAVYIAQLRNRNPGYRIHLLVHSQGNSVVSEAIAQGMRCDTYILTQGALPASAYDVNATNNADLLACEHPGSYTPDWQSMGYHGIYTNFSGRLVNFYNPLDKVLGYWIDNQKLLKPSVYFSTAHYFYDGTNSHYYPFVGDGYLVTDPEESRAMVARSRTEPIGRSGPASGHGVIQSAVNLNAQYGFNGTTVDEHSAQWKRPIQTSRPYYLQVLESIKP